jgi:hypothetical protein
MTEEIPYAVIRTLGDIEIREYPDILLATAEGRGDIGAFELLFGYITGSNQSRQTIPMTAPVVSNGTGGERIAMTAPVVSDSGRFSFVLPPPYTMETAPIPGDPRIELVPVPARRVAVLRFRGWASPGRVRDRTEALLRGLRQGGVEPIGAPFLMRYNPPYTPGFLRRNEMGVEIRM